MMKSATDLAGGKIVYAEPAIIHVAFRRHWWQWWNPLLLEARVSEVIQI